MAITDISISEELQTNAPSIKYKGNEGPKSPQEMEQMMAGMMDLISLDFEMQHGYDISLASPEMREGFIEQWKQNNFYDDFSRGPVLPSDEDPINPFQPKPQGPVLPDRQMAAYGGIMGLDGRRQYGIGSKLKRAVRKIIPNEVAEVAVKAAPFVAPFNPLAAGLMAGVGGFDQTGRIGSSLKSGLMNYGLGQGARYLGGAEFQGLQNPFTRDAFSMPTGTGGIKNLFKEKATISEGIPRISGNEVGGEQFVFGADDALGGEMLTTGSKIAKTAKDTKNTTGILKTIKDFALDNKLLTGLAAGTLGTAALMGNMKPDEIQDLQRGEGLDVEGIRAEVIEAFKDPSGEKIAALRSKYPFLGKRDTKDFAMGGRIGFDNGGIMMASAPSLEDSRNEMSLMLFGKPLHELTDEELDMLNEYQTKKPTPRVLAQEGGLMDLGGMEKDYRAEGGFVPIGREEKADDVPARLSVNEFVFTADAVRNAGGGDIDKGAEVMENMMKNLEAGGRVSEESQGMGGAQQMFEVSERLSEVV